MDEDTSSPAVIGSIVSGGNIIFNLAKWLILAFVFGAIFTTFFYSVFIVSGASMDPNFKDGEWIFWQKNVYEANEPERGDIVVVNYPGDLKHKYVKRIVGLPGEKIEVKDELVYINGEKLTESYLSFDTETTPDGVWVVPAEQYFVMGDNRPASNDSRVFGAVEKRFLLGRSVSIVFPRFRLTKDI